MAFLLTVGLDFHGSDAIGFDRYAIHNAASWASTGGKYGGGRLSIDRGANNLHRWLTLDHVAIQSASGWASCYWNRRMDSGVNAEFIVIQHPSGPQFWIEVGNSDRKGGVSNDNQIILLNGNDTLLGQSINTFTGGQSSTTIRHLDMSWTLGQGDGTFKLWVNDVLEIDVTGLTLGIAGRDDEWMIWRSEGPQGFLGGGDTFRLDDLVFQDGGGSQLLDGHRIWEALPDSDTTQNWTRSAGGDNFALVDDSTPDGDTTFIDSVNGRDVYGYTAPTITGTIRTVLVKCLAKRPSGAETLKVGMKLGASETLSVAITPSSTTVWNEEWIVLAEKPGGGSWTQADLDASEIIIEATGTGIRVTQVWVEILTIAILLPGQPTLTVDTIRSTEVDLSTGAFVTGEGGAHQATQWQVTLATDGGFASPVFDSGVDTGNLLSITATGLSQGINYLGRVRHQEDNDEWSDYSNVVPFATVTAPATPTLSIVSSGPDFIELAGTAYVAGTGGDPHESTQWQITLVTDPGFASPILDLTTTFAAELETITKFQLNLFLHQYIARVRYTDDQGIMSAWSNVVTSGLATTGQFYTPFGERALGFALRSADWDEVWAELESTWINTADLEAICLVVSRRTPNTPTPGEVDPIFWQGMPSVDKQIIWTRIKFDQVGLGVAPCVGDSSPKGIICRVVEGLEEFEDFEDPALTGWRVVKSGALGEWSHLPGRGVDIAGHPNETASGSALKFVDRAAEVNFVNALIVWDAVGPIAKGKWMQARIKVADIASPGYWWRAAWGGLAMGGQNDEDYYSFQNAHRCGLFSTWVFQTTYKHGPLASSFAAQPMFRSTNQIVGGTLSYHLGGYGINNQQYEYMKAALTDDGPFGQIEESYLAFGSRRGFDSTHRFSFEGTWQAGKVGLVVNSCKEDQLPAIGGPLDSTILFDHVAITTNNFVKFTGLPDGWEIQIEADTITSPFWFGNDQIPRRWPIGDAAVNDKTISFEGHGMPYDTLKLYDPDGELIETWRVGDNALGEPGIWGGDVYNISVGGAGVGAIGGPAARVVTGAPSALLLESGDFLLLESGDKLLLE